MKIINTLPHLLDSLRKWEDTPSQVEFETYLKPIEPLLRPMLEDFSGHWEVGLYGLVAKLEWGAYRDEALTLNPDAEEARLQKHLNNVENLLGIKLHGEAVLFGGFTSMDGYARFDQGSHRVYLGVDESHNQGNYLDILMSHELTHVAREPLPEVWAGFGLTPQISHDQFVEKQPLIEHLMGEGFSCLVSELLNPSKSPWNYVYQNQETLAHILENSHAVDNAIHQQLKLKNANCRSLYDVTLYRPKVARYAHYVWAWQWTKSLLKTEFGGNPQKLLRTCSKDWIEHALSFKMGNTLIS